VSLRGNIFRPLRRQKSVKLARQTFSQIPVLYLFGNVQRSIPGAGLRVNNELPFATLKFEIAFNKIFSQTFSDLTRRCSRGPIAKVILAKYRVNVGNEQQNEDGTKSETGLTNFHIK
jgi:hypothetical protein